MVHNTAENYVNDITRLLGDESKFQKLDTDPTAVYLARIKEWCEVHIDKGFLTRRLADWLIPSNARPGAIYGCYKTHKDPPTLRVITSACGTASENLGRFVAHHLKPLASNLKFVLRDTTQFLNVLEEIKQKGPLPENSILVSFDVIDMFRSIKNTKGIKAIKKALNERPSQFPDSNCILSALKICLETNCTSFDNQYYLQIDGAATGPRYVCDYADLAMVEHDLAITEFNPRDLYSYSRYRDDCFLIWTGSLNSLYTLFQHVNSLDPDIQFTCSSSYDELDYLDVRVTIEDGILRTEVYSKPTAGHLYLHPDSCHPKNQIDSIPYSQALRLNRNTSNSEKLSSTFEEYKNHFEARGYDRKTVNSHFEKARELDRNQLLNPQAKTKDRKFPLVLPYNPKLPNVKKIFSKNIHILHLEPDLKNLFPLEKMFPAFKRGKNLKEILSPSRYKGGTLPELEPGCKRVCNGACDLCSFLVEAQNIRSIKTKEILKINKSLTCNSKNVIYVLTDKVCNKQCVGSALDMKKRLGNYKSHIKLHKVTCNVVQHWWNVDAHLSVHPVPETQEAYSSSLKAEMSFTLVDQVEPLPGEREPQTLRRLKNLEGQWEHKLQTLHPHGLNIRNEARHSFN